MSLRYALLGLLGLSPMAGYDLKKVFDSSINFFWAAHTSQIYRELKALEQDNLVDSALQRGENGPDKRMYSITDAGRASFAEWLTDFPEPVSPDTRNAFLVRVFFSSEIGIEKLYFEMQRKLNEYKKDKEQLARAEGQLTHYAEALHDGNRSIYWKICLSMGVHSVDANIAWAEETLAYLAKIKEGKQND
jgi:PadR family transcriptional regulator, regulatory protein AphA